MLRLAIVVSIVASVPHVADACSVSSTFIAPTNFELVADVDAIVVARAERTLPGSELTNIKFAVTAVVKGKIAVGDTLTLQGIASYRGASNPHDFSKARPGAYAGGCVAYDYALGHHFLLFLRATSDGWGVAGTPFARVNEEVDPRGDAWSTAVRDYARIAALPAADRSKELHALHARYATGGVAEHAIASDLDMHFASPTPGKPFAELEAMYRAKPDSRTVLAIGVGGDPAARAFMAGIVDDLAKHPDRADFQAVASYFEKVADPAVVAKLAAVYVALGPSHQSERWPVMWLLIRRADASHQAMLEKALAGASDEEAGRLGAWFARHPSEAARKEIRRRIGTDYDKKWELALAAAGVGDADVVRWAQATLAAPPDDDRWKADYVLARSPLPAADAAARTIIAKGGPDLVALVQGYGEAVHANVDARLADIERTSKDAEVLEWLARARADRASTP
jgi:hypothetical protein